MLDVFSTKRSAADVLSRIVRIELGGQTYELPVRSIRANREWKAQLTARLADFLGSLEETDDLTTVTTLVGTQTDDLLDMLVSYDSHGVLPSRDDIEDIEPDVSMQLVKACGEVWRAASPLVVTALADLATEMAAADSSPPTSSPPTPMAGRRRRSKTS